MRNRKRDNSTEDQSFPTDSMFQSVDVNADQFLSLAEYLGWVGKTHGEVVVKNATLLDLWIQKFRRYVSLLSGYVLVWLGVTLGKGGVMVLTDLFRDM